MATLKDLLIDIGEYFKKEILADSKIIAFYDLGFSFSLKGLNREAGLYKNVKLVMPLKEIVIRGTNFDGRILQDYVQFKSGIVVPKSVAEQSSLQYKTYYPKEKMILTL